MAPRLSCKGIKFSKLASNIIHPTNNVRLKSFINRDNKKDACTMRDPCLGLTLLQIAVMADNVPAGTNPSFFGAYALSVQRASRVPMELAQ